MNIAIIPAAGAGQRMGTTRHDELPKQFRSLAGTPVIVHTLRRFEESRTIEQVIVAAAPQSAQMLLELAHKHGLRKLSRVVVGGSSRAESVWRAVQAVRAATANVIAVHDAVRPFVTADEIDRTVLAADKHGAAILSAPVIDTIKECDGGFASFTLARHKLRRALTPQCFRYNILRAAYEKLLASNEAIDSVTDDSQVVERTGVRVAIIDGDARNIKLTMPQDFSLGEILIKQFDQ